MKAVCRLTSRAAGAILVLMIGENRARFLPARGTSRMCGGTANALLSVFMGLVVCLAGVAENTAQAAEATNAKEPLRVIYFGELKSARGKDFVSFLESHFVKVGSGELAKFRPAAANDYDVVIMDYGEVKVANNRIQLPDVPFGKGYSRPTMMLGASGALMCGNMGLKTAYL
jgi:hypothetical protein